MVVAWRLATACPGAARRGSSGPVVELSTEGAAANPVPDALG